VVSDVSVRELLVLVLAGLKAAVTPLGSPDADRFTALLKPLWQATLIVVLPLVPPTGSVRLLAEEVRVKPGGGMVSAIVVVRAAVPEVPVTVTGYVPGTAVLLTLKVSASVLALTLVKADVTPGGTCDTARLTLLARPIGLMTTISMGWFQPFWPTSRVRSLAEDERLKLGAGMVKTTIVEFVVVPEVPVTVSG
jgi:hypothetical protein